MKSKLLASLALILVSNVQAIGFYPTEVEVREFGRYPLLMQVSNESDRAIFSEVRIVKNLNDPIDAGDLIGNYRVAPQHKLKKKVYFEFTKEGTFYICAGYLESSVYVRSCGRIQVQL